MRRVVRGSMELPSDDESSRRSGPSGIALFSACAVWATPDDEANPVGPRQAAPGRGCSIGALLCLNLCSDVCWRAQRLMTQQNAQLNYRLVYRLLRQLSPRLALGMHVLHVPPGRRSIQTRYVRLPGP